MRRLAGFWGRGLGFCRLGGVGGADVVLEGGNVFLKMLRRLGDVVLGTVPVFGAAASVMRTRK